jgi:tryptophan synthase alpha chain
MTVRQLFDGRKKLIIYVTCGDPSADATVDIVRAAADSGADAIELGVPFSDPSADGPAIQLAMARALAGGTGLAGTLAVARRVRAHTRVPLILFGYYNPVFVYGVPRLCRDAAAAGIDGLLVVDLPADEAAEELVPAARAEGLEFVPLLAPTSSPARLARVAALAPAFVYYVSIVGITGAALTRVGDLPARVAEVRAAVRAPVAVGFGVATPADARAVAVAADAVVVGSAVVRAIERNPADPAAAVARLTRELKAALE